MADEDLGRVQAIAANDEDPNYPLPMQGRRITHNTVTDFAATTSSEGEIRPRERIRRRAQRQRPARLATHPPDPASDLGIPGRSPPFGTIRPRLLAAATTLMRCRFRLADLTTTEGRNAR